MRKLLIAIIIGVTITGVIGCQSKNVKEYIEDKGITQEEQTEENQEETIREYNVLNGEEWNTINRPNGDYALKFSASMIDTYNNGRCLRVEYSVNNISFDTFNGAEPQEGFERYKNACEINMYDKSSMQVIDNNGNVLNPCSNGYNDEIILSETVYIGTIGNFAQTFFVNDNVDMSKIKILFIPVMTEFEVSVNQ